MESVIIAIVGIALGCVAGFFIRQTIMGRKIRGAEREATNLLQEATAKQKDMLFQTKEEAIKIRAEAETENRERRAELQRQEKRISKKDENLDRKIEALERRERGLIQKEKEKEQAYAQAEELKKKQVRQLELISGMSSAEAKELLLDTIEGEIHEDVSRRIREIESRLKEEVGQRAREVVALAIQRCATDVVSETTVSVVPLPSDEMKGRLIGR